VPQPTAIDNGSKPMMIALGRSPVVSRTDYRRGRSVRTVHDRRCGVRDSVRHAPAAASYPGHHGIAI
jgi:hypothetical protein